MPIESVYIKKYLWMSTAVLITALCACTEGPTSASPDSPPGDSSRHLTIYSSVAQDTAERINAGFLEIHPDVSITLRRQSGQGGEADTVFVTEALSGSSSADIVFGSTPIVVSDHPQLYANLREAGVRGLDDYPETHRTDKYIRGIDGVWGIGYDTTKVSAEHVPKTWPDVLDPRFRGKCVILEMRGKSAGLVSWALRLRQRYGDEFLKQLADQRCLVANTGQLAGQIIAAGGADIGFPFFPSMVRPSSNAGAPLRYRLLTEPAIGVGKYIEIPQDAPNKELAVEMMSWFLTPEGQSAACNDETYGSPVAGVPGCGDVATTGVIGPEWSMTPDDIEEIANLLGMVPMRQRRR